AIQAGGYRREWGANHQPGDRSCSRQSEEDTGDENNNVKGSNDNEKNKNDQGGKDNEDDDDENGNDDNDAAMDIDSANKIK
ncbi:hypothetical protein C0995_011995, partial [Termitomyces sp. Mi166